MTLLGVLLYGSANFINNNMENKHVRVKIICFTAAVLSKDDSHDYGVLCLHL